MHRLGRTLGLIVGLCMTSRIDADVSTNLNNFFKKMGFASNVTSPKYMQDQSAGYVSGGGLSLRGKTMETKLAHVELPSMRFGDCGDIDIFTGGFSFISGEELVRTLKNVASNAVGYAFMLALETISPQFANTVKQLQSWANTINGMGINSCETAASLVGAAWPRSQMASQAICRSQASKTGILNDYVASRHGCSERSTYDRNMNEVDRTHPNLLKDEFNIAWKVIHDTQFMEGEGGSDMKHLLMSISGTVVARKDRQGGLQIEAYPSKVFEGDFIQQLMEGGSLKIYTCRDAGSMEKCLTIGESTLTISADVAMHTRVDKVLMAMQQKVVDDIPFNQDEIRLLNTTRLPLLRILNVMSAYRQGTAPVSLSEYSEGVALDMLCQYIRSILDVIRLNISKKSHIQFDTTLLERFEASLMTVEQRVKEYELKAQKRVDQLLAMERKLNILEKDIFSRMRGSTPY